MDKNLLTAAKLGISSAFQKGVDIQCVNAFDETPLHIAVRFGQEECAEKLISLKALLLDAVDIVGNRPIHTAATYGKTSCVQLLAKKKAELLTLVNKRYETPLYLAVRNGRTKCVEQLLELGASLQVKDCLGDTPLHSSIINGKRECLEILLEQGASVFVLNRANQTPAETATEYKRRDLLAILEKYQFQGLFTEITSLGVETVKEFKDMLSAGSYKCFWNRVYLAGPYNVGKTTLAKNLVGDPVPETRESTDGIWIYLGRAGMNTEERKWIFLESGTALNATVQSFLMTSKKDEIVKQPKKTNDEDNRSEEEDLENSSKEDDSDKPPVKSPEKSTDQPEQVRNQHDNNAIANPLPASENRQPDIVIIKLPQTDEEATKDDNKQPEVDKTNEEIMKLVMAACKEGKYKMKIVPIDLWDFGGQKIYYMTHQLFISSRGTFVIVFNGSLDIFKECTDLAYLPGQHGKRTIAGYLIHWVNSILTYCQTSKEGFPKILFVATHKDKVMENVEKQREKLTASIEKLFENHTGKPHLQIRPLIFVNAKDKSDPEVNNLRKILVDTAFSHPRWGEPMPTLFVPLELQLTKMGKKIMKRTEIVDLNAENETMALKSSQLETFLKLQHALGKYIYFNEGHLKDFVVIDPTYLIEVLRSVVTEEQFWPKDKELRDIFVKLKGEGKIRKVDLLKLWEQKDFCHILQFKEYMIEMLIHLDIIIEPSSSFTTNQSKMSEEEKFYLVPCMITKPNKTPVDRTDTGIHMAYTFIKEIIPPAFLYRFLGSFISMWKMKSLYTDRAVVSIDKVHELTVNVDKNRLVVTLVHAENKKDIVPTIASTVQESLTRAIVRISQFYWAASDSDSTTEKSAESSEKKTVNEFSEPTNCNQERNQKKIIPYKIEFGVHCTSRLCFFDQNKVTERANYKWECRDHGKMHDTSELKKWYAEKSLARKDGDNCDANCSGLGPLKCQRKPSDKELGRLAAVLFREDVKSLCYQLGLRDVKYDELYNDHPNTADLKFFALFQWKQSQRDPKFWQLKKAFEESGYGHHQHKLCEVFREIEIKDLPKDVKTLMGPPEDEFLEKLSNNIGDNIVQLGIELGIDGAKLQAIVVKYPKNLMEQTKEMLREWKKRDKSCYYLAKAFEKIKKPGTFFDCFEDLYGLTCRSTKR